MSLWLPDPPDPLLTHRTESFRIEHLDRHGESLGDLDGVIGGTVELNANAPLRGGGSLLLQDQNQGIDWGKDRVRIWWEVEGVEPWPLGVYLLDMPTEAYTESGKSWEIGLIDKLAVLQDDAVEQTFSLPAGTVVTTAVRDLIQSAGETQISITSSTDTLANMRVWDAGESKLRIINDLLDSINYWALWTDGHGQYRVEPYVRPENRAIAWRFHEGIDSIHTPDWVRNLDLGSVPNKVILVSQAPEDEPSLVATATNENPASPTSYQARGRWVTHVEDGIETDSQSALQAMTDRKLADLSSPAAALEVTHAAVPLWYNELVSYRSQGHEALATVTKFAVTLAPGALVAAEWREIG